MKNEVTIDKNVWNTVLALLPKDNQKNEVNNILIDFDEEYIVATDTKAIIKARIKYDGELTGRALIVNTRAKREIDAVGVIVVNGSNYPYNLDMAKSYPDIDRVIPNWEESTVMEHKNGVEALYDIAKKGKVIPFVSCHKLLSKLEKVDGFSMEQYENVIRIDSTEVTLVVSFL